MLIGDYSPKWYDPYNPTYDFHDAVYYTMHYGFNVSFFVALILFIQSPKELNKVWIRFSLLVVCFLNFIAEIFETINLYIPKLGNYGYNEGTYVKIFILLFSLIIAFTLKKTCMKILNFIRSD